MWITTRHVLTPIAGGSLEPYRYGYVLRGWDMSELQTIPGSLTETSLELPTDLPYEHWVEVGETLRLISRSIQWYVGDWLAYGEDHYGEDAFSHLEQSDKTLANWASTCRHIEPSRRREEVSYSVHAEVAPLEPGEQVNILEEAAREGWTVGQTRERVREIQQKEAEEGHGPSEVVVTRPCPACEGTGRIVVEGEREAGDEA